MCRLRYDGWLHHCVTGQCVDLERERESESEAKERKKEMADSLFYDRRCFAYRSLSKCQIRFLGRLSSIF